MQRKEFVNFHLRKELQKVSVIIFMSYNSNRSRTIIYLASTILITLDKQMMALIEDTRKKTVRTARQGIKEKPAVSHHEYQNIWLTKSETTK